VNRTRGARLGQIQSGLPARYATPPGPDRHGRAGSATEPCRSTSGTAGPGTA